MSIKTLEDVLDIDDMVTILEIARKSLTNEKNYAIIGEYLYTNAEELDILRKKLEFVLDGDKDEICLTG
jgi:hypothetical protein